MAVATPEAREIQLIPLIRLDEESQLKVLEIRNEADIRKWMYTDHVITAEEHMHWIKRLKEDGKQIVFAVKDSGLGIVGMVSAGSIDRRNRKSDWANYLAPDVRGGLGSAVGFAFINFIFNTLGMEKVNSEIIEGNTPNLKLHSKLLFQEEGFRRENVLKDGVRVGVHFLGLTKRDWSLGKGQVYASHAASFDRFAIAIQWDAGSL